MSEESTHDATNDTFQEPTVDGAAAWYNIMTAITEAVTPPPVSTVSELRKRARARWVLTLPSGATVKVQRPDWGKLIGMGLIQPDQLIRGTTLSAADAYAEFIPILKRVVPHIVIDPPIRCANGDARDVAFDESVLDINEMQESDIAVIFAWANGHASVIHAIEVPE